MDQSENLGRTKYAKPKSQLNNKTKAFFEQYPLEGIIGVISLGQWFYPQMNANVSR